MAVESSSPANGPVERPFSVSADVYDIIYGDLPYTEHAERITALVRDHMSEAATLLEVGCGTGLYLDLFRHEFAVEGLDISPDMLEVARHRMPDIPLHLGDMRTFELRSRFDVIACLFSSIGYMETRSDLLAAVANFVKHLAPGGVLVIDAWFTPGAWISGHIGTSVAERDGLVVARISHGVVEGAVSVMDMHHLVGRPGVGVKHYVERHRMGLFTHEEFMGVFAELGFDAYRLDDLVSMGRNRYFAFAT